MNDTGGIQRIIKAFGYSMDGLRACLKNEQAFRQEIYLAVPMIPGAFFVDTGTPEKLLLVGSVVLVLVAELLNSAIENVVDRISEERHELSKRAKDAGSAAVLLCLLLAGLCWGMILFESYG